MPKFGALSLLIICRAHLHVPARTGGFLDTALVVFLLPGDALGVDTEQDVDAVASPLGDLWRGNPGGQPGGNRRVSQVVGPPSQQRGVWVPETLS